ncbi:hypothetical protein, partial [Aeromonas veronii]|uniref:hypothetical protein n=1 Tax=Aeromonas veronii TaxID=654 RepID=UPI001E55271B
SGRGSDGVCECDKQTEQAWSASQKAPSVTVTWGCRSHDFLADLGNNALYWIMIDIYLLDGLQPSPIDEALCNTMFN